MECKIYILRHGESLGNAKAMYLGHTDWDLSPKGKAQAEAAAEYLASENIAAVYSSDLVRAYNTALPHARRRGLSVRASRELREVFIGDWECMKIEELEEKYPVEFCIDWRKNFGTCKTPGGESIPEVAERLYNEILRIGKAHPGENVIIASHAAAIRSFWGRVTGTPAEEVGAKIPFPSNASTSTVICDGERLIPVSYSYDGYLNSKDCCGTR